MNWKIQSGKFLEKMLSFFIIGMSRICFICKITNTIIMTIISNRRLPFLNIFTPVNSFKLGFTAFVGSSIKLILLRSARSQICSTIIQAISINMISLFRAMYFKSKKKSVHLNCFPLFIIYGNICVSIKSVAAFQEMPFPLIQPIVVGIVNKSKMISTKRNFLHMGNMGKSEENVKGYLDYA